MAQSWEADRGQWGNEEKTNIDTHAEKVESEDCVSSKGATAIWKFSMIIM